MRMNGIKKTIFYLIVTALLMVAFYLLGMFVQHVFGTDALIPALFILNIFLISVITPGYWYGVISSLISVLIVNHSFMFPYLRFNFSISENLISAVIMLALTIMTSTLTTKVKQMEKVRVESETDKVRANLLRAISHDLRTPLTTIYGSSSAIMSGYDRMNREQIMELAKGIKEDSEWMIRTVENLLMVTRIDGSGVNLIKTPVVLEELIDAVLIQFGRRYPQQTVHVEIPEAFISIPMDVALIEQVIINFLENAVQHAEGMTELSLKVHTDGNQAVFGVTDNGCGIPRERLAGIFSGHLEPRNLGIPVDNRRRSMGIGLSVCATIIKVHGGQIQAVNNPEGGCTFRFALQMEEEEDEQ